VKALITRQVSDRLRAGTELSTRHAGIEMNTRQAGTEKSPRMGVSFYDLGLEL